MTAGWRRRAASAKTAFRSGGVTGVVSLAGRRLDRERRQRLRTLRRAWRRAVEFGVRARLLRGRVAHLHGPERVEYGPEDLLVTCVVRNGALHVQPFMDHYRSLGVAHCVFLDNGSTDGTVEMVRRYPHVTVLQTDAPYARYENTMKRYLADRFSPGRWHLCADIDEHFDYPFSDALPLAGLLAYLNHRGFTAVVAQMLDMFPDGPLGALAGAPDDRLQAVCPFYDTSAIDTVPYEWSPPVSPRIRMHRGGIRRAVFGTNNGLTKAALVRMDGRVQPFVDWHQADGAVVADITCVLLHYPFVSSFPEKAQEAARTGRYGAVTTAEYIAYARRLRREPHLRLKRATARRFAGLGPLLDEGFLVVSDEYRRWVAAHGHRPAAGEGTRQEPCRR